MPMVKGTNKIKGVLDVGVKQQIGKGQSLYLTNDEFYNHRVQTAISLKFIVCDEAAIRGGDGSKVRVKNTYRNSLSIGDKIRDLKPGQETVLDEDELRSAHVQAAINKRMLKIVGSVTAGAEASLEATVKVGDVFKSKPSKKKGKDKTALPVIINPSETPSTPEFDEIQTNQASEALETNEEITGTPRVIEMDTEVISDPNPPPAKPAVKDPRKKAVIWNPANNPVMKPIPNAVVMQGRGQASPAMPENDSSFMEKVAKGVINADGSPNPEHAAAVARGEVTSEGTPIQKEKTVTAEPEVGPIGFVDQEQEKERIDNHPKLNTQDNADQNPLIDFIG